MWQARDTQLGREVAVKLPRSGQFTTPAEEERLTMLCPDCARRLVRDLEARLD